MNPVKWKVKLVICITILTGFIFPVPLLSQKIQVDDGNEPEYYLNIVRLYAPLEDAFIALQYYAAPSINKKDWDKAIKIYETYRGKFPDLSKRFDKIEELLKAPEKNIQ